MNYIEEIKNFVPANEQEENDKKTVLKLFELNTDLLTRENTICHFTSSAWITNKDRTKVLMIYHNIYDSWAWTGGHADGDTDLLYVAKKEVGEETGLTSIKPLNDGKAITLEILTVDGHMKRGKYVSDHLHINMTYAFEADENEVLRIKEDENSNVAWFGLDEAIEKSTEKKMKPIYKKANERIKML